jgi:uncharacterized protein YqhQ
MHSTFTMVLIEIFINQKLPSVFNMICFIILVFTVSNTEAICSVESAAKSCHVLNDNCYEQGSML